MYQYIYREAAEVYWDNEKKAFNAPFPKEWSYSNWFKHIVGVVDSGLGISLRLSTNTSWVNVPEKEKSEILVFQNNFQK